MSRCLWLLAVALTSCASSVLPADGAADGAASLGDASLGDAVGAGFVSVHADPNTGSSIQGLFWRGGTRFTWEDCNVAVIAPCVVSDCDQSGRYAGGPASAGELTVGGITVDPVPFDYSFGSPAVLWFPGEVIDIRATGGGAPSPVLNVPAFRASVPNPAPLTGTDLTPPANSLTLHRDTPLTLRWDASDAQVLATIQQARVRLTSISCLFDGRGGTGTIPAAALSVLQPSGPTGDPVAVGLAPVDQTMLVAGGFAITLQALGVGATTNAFVQ